MKTLHVNLIMVALVLVSSPALRSQEPLNLSDVLEIAGLSFDREANNARFAVVNRSPKSVLAFGYEVTSVFTDGSTRSTHLATDTASTVPLRDNGSIRAIGRHVGELRSGERYNVSVAAETKGERAVSVTAVPDFAILTDNTVVGDAQRAAPLFDDWKALRDEYAIYLPLLRGIVASDHPDVGLKSLTDRIDRARHGENVFQRPEPNYAKAAVRLFYDQSARELDNIQRCAGRGTARAECIASHLATTEARYAVYSAHAERTGGRNEK